FRVAGVPEDSGNPRVRVLHVVDGILLALLASEGDVDVHGLLVARADEIPARGVDADLIHQLVEEDDVSPSFGHLAGLATFGQVNELVDEHLDLLRIVPERRRERFQPGDVAVVIGTENVDEPLEAALVLPERVGCIAREIRWPSIGADEYAVLVVPERG